MHRLSQKPRAGRFGREAGISLLEAIVAAGLLALGLMPVAYIQSSGLRTGATSYSLLAASSLAVQLGDSTRALTYTDTKLSDTHGNYVVPDAALTNANPLAADGTYWAACDEKGCGFTRTWKITDNTPLQNTKKIDIKVTWSEYGIQRAYTLSTIKAVGS